ncbi:MAG: cyclodeaminase/cyclohydrolase family protein [Halapricum sp.]
MTVTNQSVVEFVDDIASESTLGGGSVAAVGGAMAAALSELVCRVSLESGDGADVETELWDMKSELAAERERLLQLADEDADAFEALVDAYGRRDEHEHTSAIGEATKRATSVPLEIAERCLVVLESAAFLAAEGSERVVSDAGASGYLAHAAMRTALDTGSVNLVHIDDGDFTADTESRVEQLGTTGERLEAELHSTLGDWISARKTTKRPDESGDERPN